MKASLFVVLVLLMTLVASTGLAEENAAPAARAADAPSLIETHGPTLVKNCERLVLKSLQMVLYQNHESGELATVRFVPQLGLGGKVGLTFRF